MSARPLTSTGSAAAENQLLAQLGLPPSASPEDVDDLHLAVSQFLAAAPTDISGWAHAQAAALDRAYLTLTDPVGLQGSALMSPARPPAVVPGGPATPPARRDPAPAAIPAAVVADEILDEADLDDLQVLYASVTPSAHVDMLPTKESKAKESKAKAAIALTATPAAVQVPPVANPWKRVAMGMIGVVAVLGIAFAGYTLRGNATTGSPAASQAVAQASSGAPAVDNAKVAELMANYQADPTDIDTLIGLADEFYAGGQYETASTWLDKALAIEPSNIQALLASGAVSFNNEDHKAAEATWKQVVGIDAKNVEAHYDLGFLYLNSATPDWVGVQREWNEVVRLDPTSDLAKSVKAHLDSLAAASMLPGASPAASPSAASPSAVAP
ncbi:MAG: tetratricopeptide repeat protein [Candidatus Limnocylindrales bacterium]